MVGLAAVMLLPVAAGAGEPKLIHYGSDPAAIHTLKQARHELHGTPRAFKKAVARVGRKEVKRAESGKEGCVDPSYAGVQIFEYDKEGYARGYDQSCEGGGLVFSDFGHGKRHGGRWRLILESQDESHCEWAYRYKVPSVLAGTVCWSEAKHTDLPYSQP